MFKNVPDFFMHTCIDAKPFYIYTISADGLHKDQWHKWFDSEPYCINVVAITQISVWM
jgi:hypothetical protein